MKRIASWLLVLLLLTPCAHAEGDDYFTSRDDLYYHYNANCLGSEGRVPISAEAAVAFDKGVCPVCFPIENDMLQAPQAVSRGGTIMVRFSDAWLNDHELTGVFGFMGQDYTSGAEAHKLLGQYLHGEAYNTFMQTLQESGSAIGRANTPVILPDGDSGIIMSRRHIGSDWYIIVRPAEKFNKKWDMYWRVSSLHLQMQDGTLATEFDLQTVEDHYSLKLTSMNNSRAVYTRENDDLAIEVYEALGGSIAVIREKHVELKGLENVRLVIGGRDEGIELSGYADGTDFVYCCMLTGAELNLLRGNARAELWHTEHVSNDIFRVNGDNAFDYYSDTTGKLLFTIEKADGKDPIDDDFRLVFGGMPDCFVVDDNTGLPAINRYLKSGKETITVQGGGGQVPSRVTPLFWFEEGGVFLVEAHKYKDYAVDERLFENGIQYDQRFGSGPEDEWESYLCWLVDENGNVIGDYHNQAFTIHENGAVTFETTEGDEWTCEPGKEIAKD